MVKFLMQLNILKNIFIFTCFFYCRSMNVCLAYMYNLYECLAYMYVCLVPVEF